jgi:hypothetical protein
MVGKLLIYLGQHFPPLSESRLGFVRRLFECDLCLGVWVYSVLSWGFSMYLFNDIAPYIPLLSELVTGSVTSFFMYLLSIGYRERFVTIELE